jgi:hypothetical protein
MNSVRPIQVGDREHLRLRDEWNTGHRVVIRDRDDGLLATTVILTRLAECRAAAMARGSRTTSAEGAADSRPRSPRQILRPG